MTTTPATEAIAILIDVAQRGEIDPWDVQVIDVIDRYLSTLALDSDPELGYRDTDLSQSGQAFLWASMLVLLKADTLERLEEPDELEESEELDGSEEIDGRADRGLPRNLERHLRRRSAARPPKRRPVTLPELIQQLQEMAVQLGENPLPSPKKGTRSTARSQAARIAHLAHDENLTEIATRLEEFLSRYWYELAADNDWLNLNQLLEWWTLSPSSVASTSLGSSYQEDKLRTAKMSGKADTETAIAPIESLIGDRVSVFWGLLLLSAQSKVELCQEEFYQDIKIRKLE